MPRFCRRLTAADLSSSWSALRFGLTGPFLSYSRLGWSPDLIVFGIFVAEHLQSVFSFCRPNNSVKALTA